jgi:Family of unknown function (DUF6481)
MKSYKEPSYQDRAGRAAEAKRKALDQLRAKPPANPAIAAERQAARLRRETAQAEKRAARKEADEQARAAKAEASAAAAEVVASRPAPPSEAERKASRDARYAARKSRR